jgi:hypothetical protein
MKRRASSSTIACAAGSSPRRRVRLASQADARSSIEYSHTPERAPIQFVSGSGGRGRNHS